MAFQYLPGGPNVAKESLDFITKEECELRTLYEKAKANKLLFERRPPDYFNQFQFNLACQQADEDIGVLSVLLLHAERKLLWEQGKKWKNNT